MRYCECKHCIGPAAHKLTVGINDVDLYVCTVCKDKTYPIFQECARFFNSMMSESEYTVNVQPYPKDKQLGKKEGF